MASLNLTKDSFLARLITFLALLLLLPIGSQKVYSQISIKTWAKSLSKSAQVRYNRVEGMFLGYKLNVPLKSVEHVSMFAGGGFGANNRSLKWEGGIGYQSSILNVRFSVFDRTETNDREIVQVGENSIYTLMLKWDYMDYFRAKNGFEVKGRYRFRRHLNLLGRLTAFTYESMPMTFTTGWSVFHRGRPFRVNPAIQPGDAGLIQLGAVFDNRIRSPLFRNAWYLNALYERGFREFEYNGFLLAAKRHQKLIFGDQAVILQARMGTRQSTAEQVLFDLGGFSTLRGYEIKEFTGNRMILLSADYMFRGDALSRIPLPGFHLLNLLLFYDTGWVASVPRTASLLEGFGDLKLNEFKSNYGIAVALPRQLLRINLAKRTDRSSDAWVLTARLKREF